MKVFELRLRITEELLNQLAQLAVDGTKAYGKDICIDSVAMAAIDRGMQSVRAEVSAKLDPPKTRLRVVK